VWERQHGDTDQVQSGRAGQRPDSPGGELPEQADERERQGRRHGRLQPEPSQGTPPPPVREIVDGPLVEATLVVLVCYAVAHELRDHAATFGSREQLAIEAFANAVEMIPRTLAENAGINPIDGTVNVRAAQSRGNRAAGIDGETGDVIDTLEQGIVDPYSVKREAFRTATDITEAILRIDGMLPRQDQFDFDEEGPGDPDPGAS